MTRPGAAAGRARRESGAVMVTFALMLPVLIGFCGLAVDVGNWLLHARHLQTQADAAALAGAGEFRFPCADDAITAMVDEYASVDEPGWNPQVGNTPLDELWKEQNSETFYDQASPVDDSVRTGGPCDAKMIDVKLTETHLPWWLRLANVPYINAHARVEILQKTITNGALPVGVPEVGPTKARALFVDEATGTVIAQTALERTGTSGGLAIWDNAAAPITVPIQAANIGVRIVLSGTNSTTCGDPLVTCFGAGNSSQIVAGSPGLVHVRGWANTAGTPSAPQVHDAELFGLSCDDGYFTAIAASYPCTVNVGAVVDFGGATIDPTVRILARKLGANNNTITELTPPASGNQSDPWTGGIARPQDAPLAAGSSATSVELLWQTGCPTDRSQACNANQHPRTSLGMVQRAFAGSESLSVSGPIKMVRLSDAGGPGANSFQRCAGCEASGMVVTLGLKPSVEDAQSVNDPIVSLKVAGGGSQNQSLDCDPDIANFRDELAQGCGPSYAVNTGQVCPATRTDLWDTAEPWHCVSLETGAQVGQVTQGLNERILGSENNPPCTAPNNWADFPDFARDDPRIVEVFLAPFGAFGGSGQEVVPVTGFATFYVTGWHNGGCQGQGDDPAGQGEVVGHFIKYIDTLNEGGGGEEVCDFSAFGPCIAVLTR